MSSHLKPVFSHRRPLDALPGLVASLITIAAVLSPATVDAADGDQTSPQTRFREIAPWLPGEFLSMGELIAFEEHAHFVYLAGRSWADQELSQGDNQRESHIRLIFLRPATLVVDIWPIGEKRHIFGKPAVMSTVNVSSPSGKTSRRAVCVYHSPGREKTTETESIRTEDKMCHLAVKDGDRTFRLLLPMDLGETAHIALESADGSAVLSGRQLPAGVMPFGPDGIRLIERWDSRYRGKSRPAWDKGFPSSHLKAAVEGGLIKRGRAVVLGCGTGTNAIYLAKKGFDVTAIDIAPTALNLAEEKARKAGVTIRWLLADVLAPPADLEAFDFIFDRGCYHGVRRNNAEAYVKTIKRLSRPGTDILILAGNANEERHYGPPRVKEEDLRADFSSACDIVRLDTVHFDSVDPNEQGALAWSILLRRKAPEGP